MSNKVVQNIGEVDRHGISLINVVKQDTDGRKSIALLKKLNLNEVTRALNYQDRDGKTALHHAYEKEEFAADRIDY